MKQVTFCLAAFMAAAIANPSANASVPYTRDQRSLIVTHVGGGAGGADESRLQTTTFGMGTIGFGAQITPGNSIADDVAFTLPTHIDTLTFHSYQTGSTTTPTFTDLRVQIWNGQPNQGGAIILGDLVTNRFGSAAFSGVYRVTETTSGNATRPIMAVTTTDLNWDLNPGTYWIEFRLGGSLASGPWAVPITILGLNGEVGANGLQCVFNSGTGLCDWNNAVDGGVNTPAQGFPITISGTQPDNADLFASIDDQRSSVVQDTIVAHEVLIANPGPSAVVGAHLQTTSSNYTAQDWTCTTTAPVGNCPSSSGSGEIDLLIDLPVGSGFRFTSNALSGAVAGQTASRSVAISSSATVVETDGSNNQATDNNDILADALFENDFEDATRVSDPLLRDILGLDQD